jgi:uncharacterized protein (TIGR02246 family)
MTVAEVDAVARAFHDGVAGRDAAALVRLYHEDARLLVPGMAVAEGHEAIEATMQALLDMGASSLDIEPLDVREAGDLTVEYGRYTMGIDVPGAPAPVTDVGKYLVVHDTRDDGTTKILYDACNSDSPPAG